MRPMMSAVLVGLVALAAPYVIAYVQHTNSYAGICGPHAPDIAAHPCTREEYLAEFDRGFAGVGLFILTMAFTPVAVGLAALAYLLHTRAIRPR